MDQNTTAVDTKPVEHEYRRLTREEVDAILRRDTYIRTPSGTFEEINLHGGRTVEPYFYDYHGISQPMPPVVYLRVQKADYGGVALEVGTDGDNVARDRQLVALKASRRDTLNRLAGAAGRPALFYDEAVQLAVDALKEQRELRERVATLAAKLEEQVARGVVVYGWKESDAVGVQFSHMFVTNQLTPAKFMELAQTFFRRSSVWTADEAWVRERLADLAHVPPGKFIQEDVARRMCELAFDPTASSPTQRARKENTAGILDAWLHDLCENRPWLGSTGGPAFGPTRTEMYVRLAFNLPRRRVTITRGIYNGREVPGFYDTSTCQFVPLGLCLSESIIPEGFREVDLAELQVGQQVLVRDDRGELVPVTVASRAHVAPDGTATCTSGPRSPASPG